MESKSASIADHEAWPDACPGDGCLGPETDPEYEAWNHGLAHRLLSPESRERLVYLSVDEETLAEVAEAMGVEADKAVADFTAAVVRQLVQESNPYRRILFFARQWHTNPRPNAPPPYLALLCLCVLAASQMASDAELVVRASNYYVRYNRLIGYRAVGEPPGFSSLRYLWSQLSEWLDSGASGSLAKSTIRSDPNKPNIGYPLSQCLLREVDRRKLTYFFRAVRLKPGDDVSVEELLVLLKAWSAHSGSLTAHGRRVVASSSSVIEQPLMEIIADEFEVWDGELKDVRGRRVAVIALQMWLFRGGTQFDLKFVARRPEGFPEGDFQTPDGRRISVTSSQSEWYDPLDVAVDEDALGLGLELTQGAFSLSFSPAPVMPFRENTDLGGWVSVAGVDPGDVHWVLTDAEHRDEVAQFALAHAQPGWSWAPGRAGIPSGWEFLRKYEIDEPVADVTGPMAVLSPLFQAATSLRGGLQIGPRIYIRGGEPDVWVGVRGGDTVDVSLDGQSIGSLTAEGNRVALSDLDIAAGAHELKLGPAVRRFTTVEGFKNSAVAGSGRLATLFEHAGHVYRPRGLTAVDFGGQDSLESNEIAITGARLLGQEIHLPHQASRPLLVKSGYSRIVVLGNRPGELEELRPPGTRKWLRDLGLDDLQRSIEYYPKFRAQWIIKFTQRETALVQAAVEKQLPPTLVGTGDESAETAWARALINAADFGPPPDTRAGKLWPKYLRRAEALLNA